MNYRAYIFTYLPVEGQTALLACILNTKKKKKKMGYVCCSGREGEQGRVDSSIIYKRQVAQEALGQYTFASMWGYKQACYDALRAAE